MSEKKKTVDKKKVIEEINAFKNKPIAPLKDDLLNNTSDGQHKALMQYNAMLDNITIGAQTSKTITYAGINWTLRLLTAEEYVDIRLAADRLCKENDAFEDYYVAFCKMTKILSRALTPSQFKTSGEGLFSEDDLKQVNYDVLEVIYQEYCDFVRVATQKPTEFTDEEIEALWEIAKKKPEVLTELERWRLQAITHYAMNYCASLEKMRE